MSIETNFDREVTLVPRPVVAVERGREVTASGTPVPGLAALRRLADDEEDVDQRDQQVRTWDYMIQARHPETGAVIDPTGYDWIVDGSDTLEIIGTPRQAVQRRRGRVHHLEFKARESASPGATLGS